MQLYGIISEKFCRLTWDETARRLVGNVDVLQLREKELPADELLLRARYLRKITRGTKTLLFINDRPDIALLSEADGVHLGQNDLPAKEVRKMWGDELLIGLSTHSFREAQEAEKTGVDYIGVGPVFPTPTKPFNAGKGLNYVMKVCNAVRLPTVAIGGIKEHNAHKAANAGAQAIAAISELCGSEFPGRTARHLRSAFQKGKSHS